MWTPSSPDFEALVASVLGLALELDECKVRLAYLENALLLEGERDRLNMQRKRRRDEVDREAFGSDERLDLS